MRASTIVGCGLLFSSQFTFHSARAANNANTNTHQPHNKARPESSQTRWKRGKNNIALPVARTMHLPVWSIHFCHLTVKWCDFFGIGVCHLSYPKWLVFTLFDVDRVNRLLPCWLASAHRHTWAADAPTHIENSPALERFWKCAIVRWDWARTLYLFFFSFPFASYMRHDHTTSTVEKTSMAIFTVRRRWWSRSSARIVNTQFLYHCRFVRSVAIPKRWVIGLNVRFIVAIVSDFVFQRFCLDFSK